jgi:F-type H+-transporting ATPase subunit epsilon
MKLKIILPAKVLLESTVTGIVAEAQNGSFGLLPRHIDMVTALVPGILAFRTEDGEHFAAIDEGMLVKCGERVIVSVRDAVYGADLGSLEQTVRQRYQSNDEQEREMRSALARLESGFMRRFMELRNATAPQI